MLKFMNKDICARQQLQKGLSILWCSLLQHKDGGVEHAVFWFFKFRKVLVAVVVLKFLFILNDLCQVSKYKSMITQLMARVRRTSLDTGVKDNNHFSFTDLLYVHILEQYPVSVFLTNLVILSDSMLYSCVQELLYLIFIAQYYKEEIYPIYLLLQCISHGD